MRGVRTELAISQFVGRFIAWIVGFYCVPAHAHGFGERYLLPVPLWLYLAGAGATVVLSVVFIALFASRPIMSGFPRFNLFRIGCFRPLSHPVLLGTLRICSIIIFVVVVFAGIAGQQTHYSNIAPTMVWVVWWVGMAFVCAFFGNLWALVNPWKILFSWAENLHRVLARGRRLSLGYRYPEWLGAWPAVLSFFAFAWLEIIFIDASQPWFIGVVALAYSGFTLIGMLLFGKHVWLRNCECFSVYFALLARAAITEVRVTSSHVCRRCSSGCRIESYDCLNCDECLATAPRAEYEWNLRPPCAGLTRPESPSVSKAAFVLLMLTTVSFDGIQETTLWTDISIPFLSLVGSAHTVGAIGLAAFSLLFAGAYLSFHQLMVVTGENGTSRRHATSAFVYSLVPIAIAYHFAHYAPYLFIQGQLVISLASDPLGLGWDLFSTRDVQPSTLFTDPRTIWFSAVITIVLGHLLAVFVSHVLATRVFSSHTAALRSQAVMVILMVAYTMTSLWIVSQPLILDSEAAPR